jgi:hypothetical protein
MPAVEKPAQLRVLEKERVALEVQLEKTTRFGGQGDPQFKPWIESRLRSLGAEISRWTKVWEERKATAKKAAAGPAAFR